MISSIILIARMKVVASLGGLKLDMQDMNTVKLTKKLDLKVSSVLSALQ